jgi:hypothetical protein
MFEKSQCRELNSDNGKPKVTEQPDVILLVLHSPPSGQPICILGSVAS